MTLMPVFTVFTATYNRGHTLGWVHESLKAQTFRNFEWLIVDDGSSDNTADLVAEWQSKAPFTIRYFCQANGGKHVAFNRGVREARGHLFLALDSDDTCKANALERLHERWVTIPSDIRDQFSGITCLCEDEDGRLIDGPLPRDVVDGHPFEVMSQLRRRKEMWGFHRTDILRSYPFPEFPGERYVPEGLVWNRIGRRYKIRFINEALRRYHYSSGGITASIVRVLRQSPQSTVTYYSELLDLRMRALYRIRGAANLWRYALVSGLSASALATGRRHPILIAIGLVPGLLLASFDALRLRLAGAASKSHTR